MHIKRIIIEGFKCYKEQVTLDPCSSKVNCIVGANGSGKTIFFNAIQFVLGELFLNLYDDGLPLHAFWDGASQQAGSAFVEIVFDNSDKHIPFDKDEMRIRRIISSVEKDEYLLDAEHATKNEVLNVLESAGISRANPYYAVQQAKISSIASLENSELLDLLKGIGGTHIYEERKREWLKKMAETENKRQEIDQYVDHLKARLRKLDEEKEELKKYHQLDKERRSLEYIIFDKELHGTRKDLEKALKKNYEPTVQDLDTQVEQLLMQGKNLHKKEEEYLKKIKDLDLLPSDVLDTYKKKVKRELEELLHNCKDELQKYSSVNKEAYKQYINLMEKIEFITKQRDEYNDGYEKIKTVISTLDERKNKYIECTFGGVPKYFQDVFGELVRDGSGCLVMIKKKDGDLTDDDHDDRVDNYIGVQVEVAFPGQSKRQLIEQLSDGQKTVVALALMFAIYRYEPAPFYLFDEIDTALDHQYRTVVANMIRQLADTRKTQFFISTLEPELVNVADKIYSIAQNNRVTRISASQKDAALDFIKNLTRTRCVSAE